MSHVVSSQPSSTSPYQPTEIQENSNGNNLPRKSITMESHEGHDECCFHADRSQGCFMFYCCTFFANICEAIRSCTECCCDCCADCLNDCCEDKPDDKNRRKRYNNASSGHYDFNNDDTWVVDAIQHHNIATAISDSETHTNNESTHHSSNHHNSCHDSGTHHSGSHHDSGTHHSSSHNDSGHHTSSHDTGHYDSGTCDSGWGDSGGCDSGGGGCDD